MKAKNKNKKIALIGIVILVMIVIAGIKHYTKGETQLIGRWDVYNKHMCGLGKNKRLIGIKVI